MTAAQWQVVLQKYEQGDQQLFSKFYTRLRSEYAPIFRARYPSLAHVSFEEIFNDKILTILQRSLDSTLEVVEPKKIIYRAIDYYYLDLSRQQRTKKHKSRKTEPLEEKLDRLELAVSIKTPEEYLQEQQMNDQQLQQINNMDFLDDFGKAVIKGVLSNKKDKEIREEIGYTATPGAFSQRKKNLFSKIRRHFYHQ